jgi:citrate lyase subunit gamma (acyl carrier protein)
VRSGAAGTLESNDALVTVQEGLGVSVEIDSIVDAFFHEQIDAAVRGELARLNVKDISVTVQDKGALDCTLRARVRTAVRRMEESK